MSGNVILPQQFISHEKTKHTLLSFKEQKMILPCCWIKIATECDVICNLQITKIEAASCHKGS